MSSRRTNNPALLSRFTEMHRVEPRRDHVSSVRGRRVSALSARLEEALVFIIHQDG